MKTNELINFWKSEEAAAHIHGWDFSHIEGRYTEETDLPWSYRDTILRFLRSDMKILDMDTGGGEFLLSLGHPYTNTSATEGYPPNIELCSRELLPLGIDFKAADCKGELPFENDSFDLVINRHGDINAKEINRVLKNGGVFITEQVGAENDRILTELLLPDITGSPFPEQYLSVISDRFKAAGFDILQEQECHRPIKFFDVGALVWFAHIIEWEFPGFSVDKCTDELLQVQRILEEKGCIEGEIHRFLLVAKKA